MNGVNQFDENEMVVIIHSLLAAVRVNLNAARKHKDTDIVKYTAYIAQAQRIIILFRKIADNSNAPGELNGQIDAILGRYADV